MKTFTTLKNLATSLTNNTSTTNATLMGQLISDRHRYLLQRFFDNERTYTTSTVGSQTLTLTGTPIAGATSATLTAAWDYLTCTQLVVFAGGEQRTVTFTKGSTAITWSVPLNDAPDNATVQAVGVQAYPIPANVSKIKNNTISKYRDWETGALS